MTTPEMLDFIIRERAKTTKDEQIKTMLMQNGWSASDVVEGFEKLSHTTVQAIPIPPVPPISPSSVTGPVMGAPLNPPISTSGTSFVPHVTVTPQRGQKNYTGIIFASAAILLIVAGGAWAAFSPSSFRTLPIVRNFYPQSDVAEVPTNTQVATDNTTIQNVTLGPKDYTANIPSGSFAEIKSTNANCLSEVQARDPKFDASQSVAISGRVDFTNSNFPLSSLTVESGVIDKSKVKADGTFCVERTKRLLATLITISFNGKSILGALSSLSSVGDVLVISPESTALSFTDLAYSALYTEEKNYEIINLIRNLPEGKDYIQAVDTILLDAKADFNFGNLIADGTFTSKLKVLNDALDRHIIDERPTGVPATALPTTSQNTTTTNTGMTASGTVNRTQISGKSLIVETVYGDSPVGSDGSFTTKVSGKAPQLVVLKDDTGRLRGEGTFYPLDKNVTIDLSSTTLLSFFPLPGPSDTNLTSFQILTYAKTTKCYAEAVAYLKPKLLDSSFDLKSDSLSGKKLSITQDCANELVLSKLTAARSVGQDQNTKSSLASFRSSAELYYDSNNQSYGNAVSGEAGCTVSGSMFTSNKYSSTSNFSPLIDLNSYPSNAHLTCNVDATGQTYAVEVKLNANGYWCVDSKGSSKAETTLLGLATECK